MNRVQSFACALVAAWISLSPISRVSAVDVYWTRGGGNDNWNVALNWVNDPGHFVPEAAFSERAVIGTDDPIGLLNGMVINSVNPPQAGGTALGLRERTIRGVFTNPEPIPGSLIGSLMITGGILRNRLTLDADHGADGRVLVGVDGRGYLTMTGGTLVATGLSVGGEMINTGQGLSTVQLSGASTVTMNGPGQVNFGRNLRSRVRT
jgi:hypothetical protein